MAVARVIPPCYKKLKNDNFTKILDATTKELLLQKSLSFVNFSFRWRFSV